MNPESATVILICEYCAGTGHSGFDRSFPPNPYVCEMCNGSGKTDSYPPYIFYHFD